jgi:integrase
MLRVCAGVAQQAEQPSCKRQASGSNPLTGSQVRGYFDFIRSRLVDRFVERMTHAASQLLAGGFDLRNTAARLGHSGGGATTLRHYADPVPEVDRRAAAYLAKLTARSGAQTGLRSRRRTGRAQHEAHPTDVFVFFVEELSCR